MTAGKMHADDVDAGVFLVGRLLAAQFPQWADLPIEPVRSAGTDNALYRLGENATIERITDPRQAATELAQFIAALQRIDPTGGPPPGPHNSARGMPLEMRDPDTRAAIATLHGTLEADAVTAAWETALQAPVWRGPPDWIHGDLRTGNLLAQQGRLSAIIDFGCLGVGDPACDLQVAWNFLSDETRDAFRSALGVDDATWARGRGWAQSVGLIAPPCYQRTNPVLAGISRRAIDEALADHKASG